MTMTDNRAYKQEIRNLMAVSPAKLNYTDAKKIVDAQKEFEQDPSSFPKTLVSPMKAWMPDVCDLPEALDIQNKYKLNQHRGRNFNTDTILWAYRDSFLFNLDENERARRKRLVNMSSSEALIIDSASVSDDLPLSYARAVIRLVLEFGMDELRAIMARVFVHVYSGYQMTSDDDAVVGNVDNPNYVNELLEVYYDQADAQILALATQTLHEPIWSPFEDDWVGFGSSCFGSVSIDNHMDFEINTSPTFPLNVSKMDEYVEEMRKIKAHPFDDIQK